MDLEIIKLSEVSQKEKNTIWYHSNIWNLKHNTNEPIYKTETDSWRHTEQTCGCQVEREVGETGTLGLADEN